MVHRLIMTILLPLMLLSTPWENEFNCSARISMVYITLWNIMST
uniref:Uncharacterized protein n=1 Tax=Arundo donax TaxID=35708 RepID=A0A0A9G4J4_ARUDO